MTDKKSRNIRKNALSKVNAKWEKSEKKYRDRYDDSIGYIRSKIVSGGGGSLIRQIFKRLPLIFLEECKVIAAFKEKDVEKPIVDTLHAADPVTGNTVFSYQDFLKTFSMPQKSTKENNVEHMKFAVSKGNPSRKVFDMRDYFGLPCKYDTSEGYICHYFRCDAMGATLEIWVAASKNTDIYPVYHQKQIGRLISSLSDCAFDDFQIKNTEGQDFASFAKFILARENALQEQTTPQKNIKHKHMLNVDEYFRRILETLHDALLEDMGWKEQPNNILILLSPNIHDYLLKFFLTGDQRNDFSRRFEALDVTEKGAAIDSMSKVLSLLGLSVPETPLDVLNSSLDALEGKLPEKTMLLQKGSVSSLIKLRGFYDTFIYQDTSFDQYPILYKDEYFQEGGRVTDYQYDKKTLKILEDLFLVNLSGQTNNMSLAIFPLFIKNSSVGAIAFMIPENDKEYNLYTRLSRVLQRIELAESNLQEAAVKQACSVILRQLEDNSNVSISGKILDKRLENVSGTINEGPLCGTYFLGNRDSVTDQVAKFHPSLMSIWDSETNIIAGLRKRKYELLEIETKEKDVSPYHLVCIDPEESFSSWDITDDIDIKEAAETAIMAYRRKCAILIHGTRAAMAAIMTRNMSHNMGSHVISYWNQVLDRLEDAYDRILPREDSVELIKLQNMMDSMRAYCKKSDVLPELDEKLVNKLAELKEWAYSARVIDKDSNLFFHYLQHRMDFIAEIVTSSPAWERSMHLRRDLIKPFCALNPLGMYIAYSENFFAKHDDEDGRPADDETTEYFGAHQQKMKNKLEEYINVEIETACKALILNELGNFGEQDLIDDPNVFLTNHNIAKLSPSHKNKISEILATPVISNLKIKLESDAIVSRVSIPHGTVGAHAFYSILENFIRNSAKHGSKGRIPKDLEITIEIRDGDPESDFYEIRLSDNMGNCNENFLKDKILPCLSGKDSTLIDLSTGMIASTGWGIKEMKISANFLAMNPAENLLENHQGILNTLCVGEECNGACPVNNNICYVFKLLKPLDLLIVDDNAFEKQDYAQFIVHGWNYEKFLKSIEPSKSSNKLRHKFIVLVTPTLDTINKIREMEEFISPRILIWGKNITYSEAKDYGFTEKIDIINCYGAYLNHLGFEYKGTPILIRDPNDKFREWESDKKICKYSKAVVPDEKYYAVFDRHGDLINEFYNDKERQFNDRSFYYQPYSGSSTFHSFIDNPPSDQLMKEFVSLELLEAILTKVVIVDERIVSLVEQVKNIKNINIPMGDLLEKIGIYIVKGVKKGMTLEELNRKMCDQHIPVDSSCHFLIIHQGIMEKSSDKIDDWKKWLIALPVRHKVVDSGRGRPGELVKKVRFIQISALLKMLEDFDKYSLVQTLYSLRRPYGPEDEEEKAK